MKILNKDVSNIKYEEIVEHCKEKIPEGVGLDYKLMLPKKSLSKLIAAFSNTRGGIIIIGVKEDKKSGCPSEWEGVSIEASLIETIHQLSLNVNPPPKYDVGFTDEKSGKAFLLIRVFEGDSTPYYVRNDSNVWVRTGNIRNSVDIASPEWLELLYNKRNKAKKARKVSSTQADEVFKYAQKLEEKIKKEEIEKAKLAGNKSAATHQEEPLKSDIEMCKIVVQPHFPKKSLLSPQEIIEKQADYKFRSNFVELPLSNLKPIPQGAYALRQDGFGNSFDCCQIYSNGLLYYSYGLIRQERETGQKIILISQMLAGLITIIKASESFYNLTKYQGLIDISLEINPNEEDVYFQRLVGRNAFFWGKRERGLLPKYNWNFQLSTPDFNDENILFDKIFDMAKEIHWSLGFPKLDSKLLESGIKEMGISL